MNIRSYHDILSVPRNADLTEITRAYRRQLKKYHPDMNGGSREYEEEFRLVQEAHQFLVNLNKVKKESNGNGHHTDLSSLEFYVNRIEPPLKRRINEFNEYAKSCVLDVYDEIVYSLGPRRGVIRSDYDSYRNQIVKFHTNHKTGHLEYLRNIRKKIPGIIIDPVSEEYMVLTRADETFQFFKKLANEETEKMFKKIEEKSILI